MGVEVVPDQHERAAELLVSRDEQVSAVGPGEALASVRSAVQAVPADQARRAAIEIWRRERPRTLTTRVWPHRDHVRAAGGAIDTLASSSKMIHMPSAGAVLPTAATSPSLSWPRRPHRVPSCGVPAPARTSRVFAAAWRHPGSCRSVNRRSFTVLMRSSVHR